TLVMALRREIPSREAVAYALAQLTGGIGGTVLAHLMFDEAALQISSTVRGGMPLRIAELVAAFGLVAVILADIRSSRPAVPWLVGLYITAAYWFTASTSFANPAVTIARSLTDSFSGIHPADV